MFPTEIKIRDLSIRPATILAPMAGVTDTVFRRVIRSLGACGLIMTEFTSAEGLSRKGARTLRYLYFDEDERPIAAQIFGSDPAVMASAAALTEVINSYGHHYRVTDILKVESQIGEITPQEGLLEDVGIQRTAARFHFSTAWGHNLSLNNIIDIANHGRPVIVSFPPDRYAGGHLLVVIGGNSNYVYLADSSLYNRHSLTRAQFMNWWEGFSAILAPN